MKRERDGEPLCNIYVFFTRDIPSLRPIILACAVWNYVSIMLQNRKFSSLKVNTKLYEFAIWRFLSSCSIETESKKNFQRSMLQPISFKYILIYSFKLRRNLPITSFLSVPYSNSLRISRVRIPSISFSLFPPYRWKIMNVIINSYT